MSPHIRQQQTGPGAARPRQSLQPTRLTAQLSPAPREHSARFRCATRRCRVEQLVAQHAAARSVRPGRLAWPKAPLSVEAGPVAIARACTRAVRHFDRGRELAHKKARESGANRLISDVGDGQPGAGGDSRTGCCTTRGASRAPMRAGRAGVIPARDADARSRCAARCTNGSEPALRRDVDRAGRPCARTTAPTPRVAHNIMLSGLRQSRTSLLTVFASSMMSCVRLRRARASPKLRFIMRTVLWARLLLIALRENRCFISRR